jgi:hypothetical protein
MLLLNPTLANIDLAGHLDGLNWVVMLSAAGEDRAPARVAETCAAAKVSFAWFLTADGFASDQSPDIQDSQLQHPFGSKLRLDRPTLPAIQPLLDEIYAFSCLPPVIAPPPAFTTDPSSFAKPISANQPTMQSAAHSPIETLVESPPAAQEVEVISDTSPDDTQLQAARHGHYALIALGKARSAKSDFLQSP